MAPMDDRFASAVTPDQLDALKRMLAQNAAIKGIVERAPALSLAHWYLGAGCIAQTAWNVLCGFPAGRSIEDYDLVYYDAADLSREMEARQLEGAVELLGDLNVQVDVKNEARVHLWYESRFSHTIEPYRSVEDAIDCWPTTAIGIRALGARPELYAPFGVADLLAMIVRPNRRQITRDIYLGKVQRWLRCWPALTVMPWDE
jgi:uncharacterized protein